MLMYKEMYVFCDDGVHGQVLDFSGAISCGADLEEARRMVAGALVDMAETNILLGESLPLPDPTCADKEADLEVPIYLLLTATRCGPGRAGIIIRPWRCWRPGS
jgi:predicted RNase H-like HicB family nuclease